MSSFAQLSQYFSGAVSVSYKFFAIDLDIILFIELDIKLSIELDIESAFQVIT